MPTIFISYRRHDSRPTVDRLDALLRERLTRWTIFRDTTDIPPAVDFVEKIREQVTTAKVVVVIIGPQWLHLLNERQHQPDLDHVRAEVRLAFESGAQVWPVLVEGAGMPSESALAAFPDVQPLARTNAPLPLRPGNDFLPDLEKLAGTIDETHLKIGPGTLLDGKYLIERFIAHGGMGIVYKAVDTTVKTSHADVAVKMILDGMNTKEVLDRFNSEREALARMNHPNIARVIDFGVTHLGRPFFVMEHVHGEPITTYCDRKQLTPHDRLRLFQKVCSAVQHAHNKGVIHRDIKPSNVLVEEVDGLAVPKVIDFGLAKATSGRLAFGKATQTGFAVGTLLYMSPEQAAGITKDIDTRTDIYSLGVLLYELLAGEPPFTADELQRIGDQAVRHAIINDDPPKPSTKLSSSHAQPSISANRQLDPAKLTKLLRNELEWIPLKAMEKTPAKRYATPIQFSDDIEAYLNHERTLAGKPTLRQAFRKYIIRNRGPVAMATSIIVALLIGLGVALWQKHEADQQTALANEQKDIANAQKEVANTQKGIADEARERADRNEAQMRELTHTTLLDAAVRACQHDDLELAGIMLQKIRDDLPSSFQDDPETKYVLNWYARRQPAFSQQVTGNYDECVSSRDGTIVAAVHRYEPEWWGQRHGAGRVARGRIAPFGLVQHAEHARLEVFNVAKQQALAAINIDQRSADHQFSPDGSCWAARCGLNTIGVWNARTGERQWTFRPTLAPMEKLVGYEFSDDSKHLLTLSQKGQLFSYDIITGKLLGTTSLSWLSSSALADRPQVEGLVTAFGERYRLLGMLLASGLEPIPLRLDHALNMPRGGRLCRFDQKNVLELFDGTTKKLLHTIHLEKLKDKENRLIEFASEAELVVVNTLGEGQAEHLVAYDLSGQQKHAFQMPANSYRSNLAADGTIVVAQVSEQRLVLTRHYLGQGTTQPLGTISLADRLAKGDLKPDDVVPGVSACAMNKQGTIVAIDYAQGVVDLWNTRTGKRVAALPVEHGVDSLLFSEQGDRVLLSNAETTRVVETANGRTTATVPADESLQCWALSQSGDSLVTGCRDGFVRVWNTTTGAMRWSSRVAFGPVSDVLFSADARHIFGWDGASIRQWDSATGQLLRERVMVSREHLLPMLALTGGTLWASRSLGEPEEVGALRLAPDGRSLVLLTDQHPVGGSAVVLTLEAEGRLIVLDSDSLDTLLNEPRLSACDTFNRNPTGAMVAYQTKHVVKADQTTTTTIIWDTEQRQRVFPEWSFSNTPAQFDYGADHTHRASGDVAFVGKRDIATLNLRTRTKSYHITEESEIEDVRLAPNGKVVVVQTKNRLSFWDVADVTPKQLPKVVQQVPQDRVYFSPDQQFVAVWTQNNRTFTIWDTATATARYRFVSSINPQDVRFLGHDSSQLLVTVQGKEASHLHVWNYRTMSNHDARSLLNPKAIFEQAQLQGFGAAFAPKGDRAFLTDTHYTVTDWRLKPRELTSEKSHHLGYIRAVTPEHSEQFGHWGHALGVAASPDGQHYATTGLDNTVQVWQVNPPGRKYQLLPDPPLRGTYRYAITYDPTGRYLVLADDRPQDVDAWVRWKFPQTIRVFEAATGKPVRTIAGHDDVIWQISFDTEGKRLLSCGQDGTIRGWDFATGNALFTITDAHTKANAPHNWVLTARFTPDGTQIVSGGRDDKLLKVWDVATQKQQRAYEGHRGSITRICLSPDGQRAFTACGDGLIRVWNLRTGRQKLTLAGHEKAVWGLDLYSEEGQPKRLLSTGEDGTVRLWPLD